MENSKTPQPTPKRELIEGREITELSDREIQEEMLRRTIRQNHYQKDMRKYGDFFYNLQIVILIIAGVLLFIFIITEI